MEPVSEQAGDRVEKAGSTDRYSRTFDVLDLLVGRPDGMTVTEISKRLALPISSSHNLLQRMAAVEVVNVTEDLRYSIGPRAVRLGISIVGGIRVRETARRHLQDLARSTGEDVYLAVRVGRRIAYVDRAPGNRPVTVDIRLGQSLFLHATSVGKLFSAYDDTIRRRLLAEPRPALTEHTLTDADDLCAELDRIRERGYAVSREEAIRGVVGLAVPVRDAHSDIVAAVHISALRAHLSGDVERDLLAAASATVAAVERELGRLATVPDA